MPLPRRHELKKTAILGVGQAVVRLAAAAGDPGARVFSHRPVADPYPEYERMRQRGKVYRSRLGFHLSASHDVCATVLRSADWLVIPQELTVVNWDSTEIAHPIEHSLLSMNPPEHTRLRRVAAPWFTPRALREREERIQQTVEHFLDELGSRSHFELVSEFATRVPIRVICELLGVDDTRHSEFARWGEVLGAAIDGVRTLSEWRAVDAVVHEMTDYFGALIARRRADPGDDVVSGMILSDEEFTARDLAATAGLLLGAGFETTRNLIANAVLAFQAHPEQLALLREDPALARNAVEEVLRYDSPVQSTGRLPAHSAEIGGTTIGKAQPLALFIGGANRDPEVFADPDRFDITRQNAREHLAFSAGAHYCLGSGLARIEGEIALRELFTRFPRLAIAAPPKRRRTRILRGPASIPVTTGTHTKVIA